MMSLSPLTGRTFEAPCTIEIEHSGVGVHAHVEFDESFAVRPGDEIRVHDAPSVVPFGQRVIVAGRATVIQAGLAKRLWVRVASCFEMNELYEVSFTYRRRL